MICEVTKISRCLKATYWSWSQLIFLHRLIFTKLSCTSYFSQKTAPNFHNIKKLPWTIPITRKSSKASNNRCQKDNYALTFMSGPKTCKIEPFKIGIEMKIFYNGTQSKEMAKSLEGGETDIMRHHVCHLWFTICEWHKFIFLIFFPKAELHKLYIKLLYLALKYMANSHSFLCEHAPTRQKAIQSIKIHIK